MSAALVTAALIAAVYLPDIGRGFVKDDFGWIRDGRDVLAAPSHIVFPPHTGFYRPVVTASFALDYALHGLTPRAYGFTNLALLLGCVAAIWCLLREAGVSPAAAAVGASAWAMNPHGINMAVVWLSGRTSLLLTLFAVASAMAFLKGHRTAGALLLFGALLSKEEAVALPIVLLVWTIALRTRDRVELRRDLVAMFGPLAAYVVLRSLTPAITPATAPWFYTPTTDWRTLALNTVEYLDRGGTFFVAVVVVAWLAYRPAHLFPLPRGLAIAGAAWFVGGYALTVWIPVRSSLYATFPSVGAALVCAACIDGLRQRSERMLRADVRLAAVLTAVLAFIPVYQNRNDRWVEPARVSARAVRAVQSSPPALDGMVVFEDDASDIGNFTNAWGVMASVAVNEIIRRPANTAIVSSGEAPAGPVAARYKLTGGRVERVQ